MKIGCVITKYVKKPHLIDGKKYDLRVYILVTGLSPLRIYIYKEGLVRIASETYNLSDLNNKFIHLTNTGINRKNSHYKKASFSDQENANKINFRNYKKFLEKNNVNFDELWKRIKDIAVKTIIMGENHLRKEIARFQLKDSNFFNLFGFDVLITEDLNPILLEVNKRPDMYIYDEMDKEIKKKLYVDVLNLVGLIPFSHNFESKPYFDIEDKWGESVKDEELDNAICEYYRPRGDFETIFPLKENIEKYGKLILEDAKSNKNFWDYIKDL